MRARSPLAGEPTPHSTASWPISPTAHAHYQTRFRQVDFQPLNSLCNNEPYSTADRTIVRIEHRSAMDTQLEELQSILKCAGQEEVMSRFRKVTHHLKADGSPVTQADLAVHRRLASELESRWPARPLLSEEMSEAEQQALLLKEDKALWCLDPLDGTSNYASGFPFFSLSLALIEQGQPALGIVYDPMRDECWAARQGAGAWLNGTPIQLDSPYYRLRDCLAVVDFKRLPESLVTRLATNAPYRSQRNMGSIALEWCWLASGRYQLYLHGGQKLWDYAAGWLILREAGGFSRLSIAGRNRPSQGLSLTSCMAAAAVSQELFSAWDQWLETAR